MASATNLGSASSLIDVLERVLDKSIVIDAWLCFSLAEVSLVKREARVVVASIETYLGHAGALIGARLAASPSSTAIKQIQHSYRVRRRL